MRSLYGATLQCCTQVYVGMEHSLVGAELLVVSIFHVVHLLVPENSFVCMIILRCLPCLLGEPGSRGTHTLRKDSMIGSVDVEPVSDFLFVSCRAEVTCMYMCPIRG